MIPNKVSVVVYSMRDGLSLRDIRHRISHIELNRIQPGCLCGKIGEYQLVFLFKLGGLVLINIPDEEHDKYLADFGFEGSEKSQLETEEFAEDDCSIEFQAGELKVRFNTVVLPEWNIDMLYIVALVMAQSGSLELIERDVESVLKNSEALSSSLRSNSWFQFRRRDLLNILADILETRHAIVGQLRLFSEPESTWTNEACDKLYRNLFDHFDIKDRANLVEKTLAISADTGELQLELLHTWRSELMELVIIALIMFEVVQALLGVIK
jgi:uncharacterized Rmd1/YagE family protein